MHKRMQKWREGENLKQALRWAQSLLGAWSHSPKIMTCAETKSLMLSHLSYPGVPRVNFWMTPCDSLYYYPVNIYSSLPQQNPSIVPCPMDPGLGYEIYFGQWNLSGHDLSHIPVEALNVFAWFGLTSCSPVLHHGKSMPLVSAAALAWIMLWKFHWLLLCHFDALIQLWVPVLRTAGNDDSLKHIRISLYMATIKK